jgi:uncharacterized membrane protein HdeD (DUF308 family)
MSSTFHIENPLRRRLQSASNQLLWLGVIFIVLGIAALAWPAFSTLVATLFVGWMLLGLGILALVGSFAIHGTGPFFGAFLLALLAIAAGLFLLLNPKSGELALTLMMAGIFIFQGAFEMMFALDLRPHAGWLAMLLSAIVTIVVAFLIVAAWPGISLVLLGVLVGVNFITTGTGYLAISRALKPGG